MKKLAFIFFMAFGFNALVAQINTTGVSNGAPANTTQQTATTDAQPTNPDFNTAPYISNAPITTPFTPTIQTTIPGTQTQSGDNTQYPSGDNNSQNANSSNNLSNNNGIINSPPRN
jgi:hypothetical protein